MKEKDKLGNVPGLSSVMELLRRLGNPEKKLPAIHIAGTNGKGSIMAYIEQTLIEAGLKVGRYVSPTISHYRERFTINKEMISKDDCAALLSEVFLEVDKMDPSPTSFEIETAAAFLWFVRSDCDIMLIECGMGGRLDATNVIDNAVMDILAAVSLDHMQFLGDTVGAITKEKLGIVRPEGCLVSYPQKEEARLVIDSDSEERGYSVTYADESSLEVISSDITGSVFRYKGNEYSISLAGLYQIKNAITAIEALECYRRRRTFFGLPDIGMEHIRRGLANTGWSGRFTVVSREPLFIVDGAHNEDAWLRLAESLKKYFTNTKLIFIMGVLRDKEYMKMIDILRPYISSVFTVTSDSPRALDGRVLRDLLEENGISATYAETVQEACDRALESGGPVLACGSLSFIGEILNRKG